MHIVAIQYHGKIDLCNPEPGSDIDTGGQIIYVLQACEELARHGHDVKILTRFIDENNQYSIEEQKHNDVELIRLKIQSNDYKPKEKLWPFIWEFADSCLNHFIKNKKYPDIIIGNYADAGAISFILCRTLNIPCIFIPYSLGRIKLNNLLKSGQQHNNELESKYNFIKRIFHEEQLFKFANKIIAASEHEKYKQCSIYKNFLPNKIEVIPPGITIPSTTNSHYIEFRKKPIVLAARLSKTKNLVSPIDILYQCEWLRNNTEVIIVTTITSVTDESKQIHADIEEKCKIYKDFVRFFHFDSQEEIFRLFISAKQARGIFFNPAFIEPFGLTALEAASYGLPVVITDNGGAVDIIKTINIGYLVNVHDANNIIDKICSILHDENYSTWQLFSNNGINNVSNYYSWNRWVNNLETICSYEKQIELPYRTFQSPNKNALVIICDLHDIFIDIDLNLANLFKIFVENCSKNIFLIYSTDKSIEDSLDIVKKWALPYPKIFICHSGIEVYSDSSLLHNYVLVEEWTNHIKQYHIDLTDINDKNIILEPAKDQNEFNHSNYYSQKIEDETIQERINCNVFSDHFGNRKMLPIHVSKTLVIRWLFRCWSISLSRCIVCCDLSNCMDIAQGMIKCVILNNYNISKQIIDNINFAYFSKQKSVAGVIEGLEFYLNSNL